jgi:D-alanyl-D-alanine-carboxypeptidase/D-alanyl-D-alanine-endopeptidase
MNPAERQPADTSLRSNDFTATGPFAKAFEDADRIFEDFLLDAHVPGLVYGVITDGRLVHTKALGVQDLATKRPVTTDSLFRIASMTKVFTALTILALRDDGKLRLDELAETYVPEMRGWTYPTLDSPRIRVRDLLNHSAGFATDDPWGDRQQSLVDESFSALLGAGVRFASPPATRMEYSNLGYAILGRIITNVSGRPYADEITRTLLVPLGMTSSGFDGAAAPSQQRAQGYRWDDNQWSTEPTMAHGAFGAMGGLHVTANDYAKWVCYLLAAWPPRDDPDTGPVRRATIRELAQGSNFPSLIAPRPSVDGEERSKRAATYGMGMTAAVDREFGLSLNHSGGYPGFGSFLLLLPNHDVGLFAFANRTYAAPRQAVYDAASVLLKAGLLTSREIEISADLASAYHAVGTMYEQGNLDSVAELLADNFLLDRDANGWIRDLAELRNKVGACEVTSPLDPKSALEGEFTWRCATGRVSGSILLSPTEPPRIQAVSLSVK